MASTKTIAVAVVAIILVSSLVAYVAMNQRDSNNNDDPKTSDDEYYKNGVYIENNVASSTTLNNFTLYEKPTRIFVCISANVELLCHFGLEEYIVGGYIRSDDYVCLDSANQAAYDSVKSKLTVVKDMNSWSKDVAAAADPDIIVGWSSTFRDSRLGSIDAWEARGIHCLKTNIYGNAVGTSMETYCDLLRVIGKTFNEQDTAEESVAKWQNYTEDIATKTASIPMTDRPNVLVIDYSPNQTGTINVYGTSMIVGDIVERAGGICMSDGGMDDWSLETIANTSPDMVLIIDNIGDDYTTMTDETRKEIIDWWNSIDAFKGVCDTIIPIPMYTLYMAGYLADDTLINIHDIIYANA